MLGDGVMKPRALCGWWRRDGEVGACLLTPPPACVYETVTFFASKVLKSKAELWDRGIIQIGGNVRWSQSSLLQSRGGEQ